MIVGRRVCQPEVVKGVRVGERERRVTSKVTAKRLPSNNERLNIVGREGNRETDTFLYTHYLEPRGRDRPKTIRPP